MRIIACDYDGTLFQEDVAGVSLADRDAIARFRAQGGIFGIVTGRDLCASSPIIEGLTTMLDFLICSTGAIICDGKGSIISQRKSYASRAIADIADFSLLHNVASFTVINEHTRHSLDITGKEKHSFLSIKEFNNCTIWFKTIEDAMLAEEYIKSHHHEAITYFRNFECIEITPFGVTKASAIKEMIRELDNPEVFTIGDGVTDISMIKEFYGFAIGNANPELKKVAEHHCNHVCDMIDFILKG